MDQLRELARRFAERDAADPERYPAENIADLKAARVHGGPFPRHLGGLGWDLPAAVRAVETIATGSASTALLVSMPMGLAGIFVPDAACVPESHEAAWASQVDRVATNYRRGDIYAACNSEKGAGGSLAATKTVARRDEHGVFRLTGEKILASSGRYAQHFLSTAKVSQEDLPGTGVVEFFFAEPAAPGVTVLSDWDGFGMRSTESQSVVYEDAPVEELMGFPNFIEVAQPTQYWYCLFAAIPLGCARAILEQVANPAPSSPALRLKFAEALMRYEALCAYLLETSAGWRMAAGPAFARRVLRTKTYVSQEATKLCAELFALSGGRSYRRGSPVARALADSFAGTALRPPLALGLESLAEQFDTGDLDRG
jgi:alkylation response protein AidB-like acyl-CoA dehydrogenase